MKKVNATNIGSYGDFSYPDYPQMAADFTIGQYYERYTEENHQVWQTLLNRQMQILSGRASDEFMEALAEFSFDTAKIPKFEAVNALLTPRTGWQIVGVPGLIPADAFFALLANRRFPVTHWIRPLDKLDYIIEPDLFHDMFGHVPLLANPFFADYMQEYGQGGLRAIELGGEENLAMLTTLYWYTVEFGLIRNKNGVRIYGAGIVSSKGESVYSVESDIPKRLPFDLMRVMKTEYLIDDYQKTYFVIDSFKQLFEDTRQDFRPIYPLLAGKPTYKA